MFQIDGSFTNMGGPKDDASYQKSLRRPVVPGKLNITNTGHSNGNKKGENTVHQLSLSFNIFTSQ